MIHITKYRNDPCGHPVLAIVPGFGPLGAIVYCRGDPRGRPVLAGVLGHRGDGVAMRGISGEPNETNSIYRRTQPLSRRL